MIPSLSCSGPECKRSTILHQVPGHKEIPLAQGWTSLILWDGTAHRYHAFCSKDCLVSFLMRSDAAFQSMPPPPKEQVEGLANYIKVTVIFWLQQQGGLWLSDLYQKVNHHVGYDLAPLTKVVLIDQLHAGALQLEKVDEDIRVSLTIQGKDFLQKWSKSQQ